MDPNSLTPQMLMQLQSYINHIQQSTSGQGSSGTAQGTQTVPAITTFGNTQGNPPHVPTNNDLQQTQTPANINPSLYPTPTVSATPIQPYRSVRTTPGLPPAPQGHPSPAVALPPAGSSMQPFLGRDSLGVSMAGQVNQERRASATAHIPRRATLTTRASRRRGPATPPPSLARAPNISACLFSVAGENRELVEMLRVKVKAYPPQVSTILFLLS